MQRCLALALLLLATSTPALAAELRGRVVDARTGAPLQGARVSASGGAPVSTDEAGEFSLTVPDLTPVQLLVGHAGYRPERLKLDLPLTAPLAVALTPEAAFTDRIEVTATRAREGIDPATFTNVPQERIQEAYWGQDPAMLLAGVAPGFYAYNDNGHGIGYSYFTIRGFGQARTRVTLNGAPLNDASSGELFFVDLADFLATAGDIQVQRGVFGLSGIGGAVDITTADPALEPAFSLHLGGGSFATRRLTARYESGLLGGGWALSARYSRITSDGYRDQSWVEMWNYYFSLARLGQRSRLRINLFGGPERTHLAYVGVPRRVLEGGLSGDAERDRRFNPLTFPGEIDTFLQPHYQLIHELSLAPSAELAQTFYYFEGEGHYEQFRARRRLNEYNLPPVVLPDGSVITRSDLVRRRTVDEWDAGWVPTLTWRRGEWEVIASGEVRLHEARHWGEVRWAQFYPAGIEPNRRYYDYGVDKRSAAALLRAAWQASERLRLTAGIGTARHTYTLRDDRIRGQAFSESFSFLLPRAGAVWTLGEGAEATLQAARGMREPTFRSIYDPQDYYGQRVALEPEDVWNYELGVGLRRPTWRLRGALSYLDFANEIVYAGALDDNGVPIYGNGARSRHRAAELEGSWQATSRLAFDLSLTATRNTFVRFREFGWDGSTLVHDGNRIGGHPTSLGNLTARWTGNGLHLAATVRRVGTMYLDSSEDNRRYPERRAAPGYVPLVNPAFTLVDALARLDLDRLLPRLTHTLPATLELRVHNLLDERYTSFGYVEDGQPLFIPAAGRHLYAGVTVKM